VVLELRRGEVVVRRELAHEDVRVASFRETSRDEESLIFQQFLLLPPGPLSLIVSARDAGSTRSGTAHASLAVPRLDSGSIATPIAVFRARPRTGREKRPDLVMSPRATRVFGRDSSADFYVEAYGGERSASPTRAAISVVDEDERTVYADTIALAPRGKSLRSATVSVPIGRIGFGALTLAVSAIADSTAESVPKRAPLLVTFGEGLAIASFDQMLGYLRFFTTPERLRALRDTTPEGRAHAWAAFLSATDPLPSTAENEALRDYLTRVADANARFAEESVPGWLTDRGMIFSALGEPDHRVDPNSGDPMQRTRVQVWEYQRYHTRFVFIDQSGFGRWRLTPSSEAEYHALMRRLNR
jgi:GWxTD domain-containing protein